jgi:hypothetical protein
MEDGFCMGSMIDSLLKYFILNWNQRRSLPFDAKIFHNEVIKADPPRFVPEFFGKGVLEFFQSLENLEQIPSNIRILRDTTVNPLMLCPTCDCVFDSNRYALERGLRFDQKRSFNVKISIFFSSRI